MRHRAAAFTLFTALALLALGPFALTAGAQTSPGEQRKNNPNASGTNTAAPAGRTSPTRRRSTPRRNTGTSAALKREREARLQAEWKARAALMELERERAARAAEARAAAARASESREEASQAEPRGLIQNVWVDHNVTEGGLRGMRIHVKFELYNLRGVECEVVAFFYKADGSKLMDFNQNYRATDGQVLTFEDVTPGYDGTSFEDLHLFMPLDELHTSAGTHSLRFAVQLRVKGSGAALAVSDYVDFTISDS